MRYLKRCWAEIDLDQLEKNYRAIREKLNPSCCLMAVVKADAYGHGEHNISKTVEELGADWLAVSNIEEALSIRSSGVKLPILVLGATPVEYVRELAEHRITQTVFSREYAEELCDAASAARVTLDIQVKLDTGMNRIGFCPDDKEDLELLIELYRCSHIHWSGVFTHFASADEASEDGVAYTKAQFDRFMEVCSLLESEGISPGLRHCCNSAGAIHFPHMQLDMVRIGISLYGLLPSPECASYITPYPVMSLHAAVTMVKRLPKGQAISYGRIYTAPRDMVVATIAIGYADGYDRGYSNRGWVLLHGKKAPIVGRVCMDQCMVDVTGIEEVAVGDIATVAGTDGEAVLSMDDLALLSGTVNYEKVCLVGKRVTRLYKRHGEVIEALRYFSE